MILVCRLRCIVERLESVQDQQESPQLDPQFSGEEKYARVSPDLE